MGKRHKKRIPRSEGANSGCMRGLMHLLNFRSTQKLLPDSNHGIETGFSRSEFVIEQTSERAPDKNIVSKEMEAEYASFGSPTIQELMEEELKLEHPEVGKIKPDLKYASHLEKNYKRRRNKFRLASDHHANDTRASAKISSRSNNEKPSFDLDLAALIRELNNQFEEKQIDFKSKIDVPALESMQLDENISELAQKHANFQMPEFGITDAFLDQKPMDAKLQTGDDKLYHDTLESPYLNSDIIQRLLHDKDLLLVNHVQELPSTQVGKLSAFDLPKKTGGSELFGENISRQGNCDELVRSKPFHIRNAFFRKKEKSPTQSETSKSNSSPSLSKIVVLQPNLQRNERLAHLVSSGSSSQSDNSSQKNEMTERITSSYSLKEIKRRLHHAISDSRKEQLVMATNGVLHKIPHGSKDYTDKIKRIGEKSIQTGTQSETEHVAFSSSKRRNKQAMLKDCEAKLKRETTSDHEYNMEMTFNPLYRNSIVYKNKSGGGNLGSLIGYTYLSSKSSPETSMEPESPQKTWDSTIIQYKHEFSAYHSNAVKQGLETPSCTAHIERQNSKIPEGNTETKYMEERDSFGECSAINSNEAVSISERYEEEEDTFSLQSCPDPCDDSSQQVTSSPIFARELKVPEILVENPGSPSPLSVLEPFVFEDISSPRSTTFEHVEYTLQSRQLHFEEHGNFVVVTTLAASEVREAKFKYVRTLLETSGIRSYSKLSKRLSLSVPLLDPSLFEEAEILWNNSPDELKLFFDCTNEVLEQMWERLYGCTPWLSIVRPEVRLGTVGGNLIDDVYNGIEHRFQSHLPFSLVHTISRGLDSGAWMNCRSETESILFDIGDAIFDDLICASIYESSMDLSNS